MNSDGATGFDDDGQQVAAIGFDFDAVEQSVDGPENAGDNHALRERYRKGLEAARENGWKAGHEAGRLLGREEVLRHCLQGKPTPDKAGARAYRLALGILPEYPTQKIIAERLGCTRSAVGLQLAKEKAAFQRETGAQRGP